MATVMTATMTLSNQLVIGGQKATASLTLTESGGTATNLVAIQPFITTGAGQPAGGVRIGAPANAASIAGYTGAPVTINANSSSTFNFDFVIDPPPMDSCPAEPYQSYLVNATCQTSDGSVFSPGAQLVALTFAGSGVGSSPAPNGPLGGAQILGSTTNQYTNADAPGSLGLDLGPNSYFIPFFA